MKEATLEERAIHATDAVTKYLKETRLVQLRTRTSYGTWLGNIVPERGAKGWVDRCYQRHPINYTFDYIPVNE